MARKSQIGDRNDPASTTLIEAIKEKAQRSAKSDPWGAEDHFRAPATWIAQAYFASRGENLTIKTEKGGNDALN
jgi:hypothetical protein